MPFPLRLHFDMQQRQVFIFHDEMRIVRLCRVLLAMTSKVHPGVLSIASSAPARVTASPEILVWVAVEGTSFRETSSSLSTAKSALPFPAPGRPCPIATKDGGTRLFIICLDLTRAESVGVYEPM
jgi:hypothetical protein